MNPDQAGPASKPDMSGQTLARWQKIVDLLSAVIDVPVGLIMKVHLEEIEVVGSCRLNENLNR